jgi:hypothetical protein
VCGGEEDHVWTATCHRETACMSFRVLVILL